MRIGFDIDGVLADFNSSFIELVQYVTGRNLFPLGYIPTTWNYPESLGYTDEEVDAVWKHIKHSKSFWEDLDVLPGYGSFLEWWFTNRHKHEIYFVTSRMGKQVKLQTEQWLPPDATVLISSQKGPIAGALNLDFYIDDRAENIRDVEICSPRTRAYLLDAPYNQHLIVKNRITSIEEFLDAISAAQLAQVA